MNAFRSLQIAVTSVSVSYFLFCINYYQLSTPYFEKCDVMIYFKCCACECLWLISAIIYFYFKYLHTCNIFSVIHVPCSQLIKHSNTTHNFVRTLNTHSHTHTNTLVHTNTPMDVRRLYLYKSDWTHTHTPTSYTRMHSHMHIHARTQTRQLCTIYVWTTLMCIEICRVGT